MILPLIDCTRFLVPGVPPALLSELGIRALLQMLEGTVRIFLFSLHLWHLPGNFRLPEHRVEGPYSGVSLTSMVRPVAKAVLPGLPKS